MHPTSCFLGLCVALGLLACGARSSVDTGAEPSETEGCLPETSVDCFTGPPEARGVGMCRDGERPCGAAEDVCEDQVLPAAEDCALPGNESCDGDEHVCTGTPGWALAFGDSSQQYLFDIVVDAEGDVVAVGAMGGTVEIEGLLLATDDEQWNDALVMKFSPKGELRWAVAFGDDSPQGAARVATDAERNVYVLGSCSHIFSEGPWTFGAGTIECTLDDYGDTPFLAKLSPTGEPLWIREVLDGSQNYVGDLVMLSDGGLAIAVATIGTDAAFSDVAKLGSDGQELWRVQMPGTVGRVEALPGGSLVAAGDVVNDYVFLETLGADGEVLSYVEYPGVRWFDYQLAVDGDGSIFFAGTADDVVVLQSQTVEVGSLFVMKLSPDGLEQWVKVVEADADWTALSIDAIGNPLLAGVWAGDIDFDLGPLVSSGISKDAFLVKLRGDQGAPLWQMQFGAPFDEEHVHAMTSGGAHAHYVAGGFNSQEVTIGDATFENAASFTSWDGLLFEIAE